MGLVTEPDARDVDALFDRVLHADDPAPSAAFETRNAAGLAPDDHQVRGVVDMLELIGQHPRLEAAAIQTVGVQGWDGFALALLT